MTDTFWTHAAKDTVTLILFLGALWLYWQAVLWSARRIALAEEKAQQTRDLNILYEAALSYIARREASRFTEDATAFALDHDTPLDLSA